MTTRNRPAWFDIYEGVLAKLSTTPEPRWWQWRKRRALDNLKVEALAWTEQAQLWADRQDNRPRPRRTGRDGG